MSEFRLAEPLAALSVATDLARGQPPEQALYASIIAARLGDYLGLGAADRSNAYYATLLRFAGCTATSHEYSLLLGGNDITVRFAGDATDIADLDELLQFLTNVGKTPDALQEAVVVVTEGTRADCEVGARMATRLGLGTEVSDSLLHIFERWDGHGLPNGVAGEDIPEFARMGHVATAAVMFSQAKGTEEALRIVRRWSGRVLDPEITEAFLKHADELMSCLKLPDAWVGALAEEPTPWKLVTDDGLDDICRVFGDFVDLKTPFLLGHSAHVARLAEGAARVLHMSEDECVELRRAGLLHDLGRAGISSGIWEKPEPLSTLEMDQVRLHPYHTERILERCTLFKPLARLAGQHHERADGSGYFRGLPASSMDRQARVLAAADACAELLEDRPGRSALSAEEAATLLSKQSLDSESLRAVLEVAGVKSHGVRRRLWPFGLTRREVEVLRLLARSRSLNQIAEQLVISPSTAHTHAAHVYEKAGISTRAGAALFAMENGLLD